MTMEAQAKNLPPPEPVDIASSSLLLDFDGTLIPIADTPDAVVVDRALLDLLARLADTFEGRVAIISGRSIAQLDALLGPVARLIALSGSHGCEHRWNGVDCHPVRPPELNRVAEQFQLFIKDRPEMLVEIKSYGVALHFRRAPQQEKAVHALASAMAETTGLAFQPGQMVAEIRVPGSDKGVAVTRLMDRAPMKGTTPVYLGDDDTDEAGLAATAAMGGIPVAVGPRPSASALWRLADPQAVRNWLEGLAA
ncbi:MAG TPA: trehalose-phosphatase [Sphingobium sp.]|uniref:trehalose-phosphatase n=1 Tax=Sphingobium sp. TaxID=1912891 RepID=UPI002ED67875